jgi:hypothetical protein
VREGAHVGGDEDIDGKTGVYSVEIEYDIVTSREYASSEGGEDEGDLDGEEGVFRPFLVEKLPSPAE